MPEASAVTTQIKRLTTRVNALESRLERTLRQKPVSKEHLEKALKKAQADNVAFIGKLIRRVGRAVGKVVKSPIGTPIG